MGQGGSGWKDWQRRWCVRLALGNKPDKEAGKSDWPGRGGGEMLGTMAPNSRCDTVARQRPKCAVLGDWPSSSPAASKFKSSYAFHRCVKACGWVPTWLCLSPPHSPILHGLHPPPTRCPAYAICWPHWLPPQWHDVSGIFSLAYQSACQYAEEITC